MSDKFTYKSPLKTLLTEPEPVPEEKPIRRWFDQRTEILDIEEGWIYKKERGGKRGKKLRKFCEQLSGYGDGITFWKPKLKDIVACEAKRWKARQHYNRQYSKINSAFDLVLANRPFCCIRNTNEWPGFAWVEFPHYNDHGVSWHWWEHEQSRRRNRGNNQETPSDRPDFAVCPLKQDIGDAWFNYEDRSRSLRERLGYFETVFSMAIEKKYAHDFYRDRYTQIKINLVINDRSYLIGKDERGGFGILAYPENVVTVVLK